MKHPFAHSFPFHSFLNLACVFYFIFFFHFIILIIQLIFVMHYRILWLSIKDSWGKTFKYNCYRNKVIMSLPTHLKICFGYHTIMFFSFIPCIIYYSYEDKYFFVYSTLTLQNIVRMKNWGIISETICMYTHTFLPAHICPKNVYTFDGSILKMKCIFIIIQCVCIHSYTLYMKHTNTT